MSAIVKTYGKIFGTRNDRVVKSFNRRVEQINAHEQAVRKLTDAELHARTEAFRERLAAGESMSVIRPEALAVAREVMDRSVGIRNIFNPEHEFDAEQLPPEARVLYHKVQSQIEALEPAEEIGCDELVATWQQVDVPVELYEAVRALWPQSRPPFRARPFDVQLVGGMVLSQGRVAEMKTGEGKTIVAPLACYLACIEGLQCYVVTVNDYLVQRDRDWVFPFYYHMGLTVGAIHPMHMQPPDRKIQAYQCDVVYGTNSEFGFDYLRDNMHLSLAEQVQKHRDFCIIDEVDSILIDEARTPLIISGPAHDDAPRYGLADTIARHLMQKQRAWDAADAKVQKHLMRIKALEGDIRNARDKEKLPAMRAESETLEQEVPQLEAERDQYVQYYEVELEKKAAHLTHEGVAEAQKQADIGSFYVGNNMDFPHLLENALRAHAVYQRDKEYVVQNGEVVIVDEFTGRLMIGRQWSDGLHQAVEAKERVKIKQETQTLATVTIQNYFKLFKRLAGMTGTAVTEATEFAEIYKLEVVSIPTNVLVVRDDRDDLIYLSQKDKWEAILDEIARHHDVGRPVLVGTASVENSEMLSQLLRKNRGIEHEVLNAKQHEREAHIVAHAGALGAVMIATNMAGRGTDIRLSPIDRGALLHHWQKRDLLPHAAKETMSDDELVGAAYRHIAVSTLGMKPKDLEDLSDDEVQLKLLRHWVGEVGWQVGWSRLRFWQAQRFFTTPPWHDPDYVSTMDRESCLGVLDRAKGFMQHRLDVWSGIEQMGGLHIVGTERHEARRIDNQLRGRAGRQGDHGSSRFFISLEDELMALFAKGWLMKALPKLGMKEGDALEHRMVTKAVERAQRKVEERNFEIRKNLLEYDEVMEFQRNAFYGVRQTVLEGTGIDHIIFGYINDAIYDAADTYLERDYVPSQIAEWCRQTLDVSIDSSKVRVDDLEELQAQVCTESRAELRQMLEVTLGEYMSDEIDPEHWDLRSLSSWAMSRFKVDLKQNQVRKMNVGQVTEILVDAGERQIEEKDLSGLAKFLDPLYGQRDLAEWVHQKFDLRVEDKSFAAEPSESVDAVKRRAAEQVLEQATASYRRRELEYPIEFVLEMYGSAAEQDPQWAAGQLSDWANRRYEAGWRTEDVTGVELDQLRTRLIAAARPWHENGRMDAVVDAGMQQHGDNVEALAEWATKRFSLPVEVEELNGLDEPAIRERISAVGRSMLRTELTALERFVLLQILDMAWKEHLYAMDQLRDSVSARSIADRERDPRVVYKREGSQQFVQMQKTVRDRVTELIFRARLTANVRARSVYGGQQAEHAEGGGGPSAASAAEQGTEGQRQDIAAAQRAGDEGDRPMSRRARRAAAAGKGAAAKSDAGPTTHHGGRKPAGKRRRRR